MPKEQFIEYLTRGWGHRLAQLLGSADLSLTISSAYITATGIQFLLKHAAPGVMKRGQVVMLTDLSPEHAAQGSTDPEALNLLYQHAADVRLIHLPRLHSKVYVADDQQAIITSGNLTAGGLRLNYEYGFLVYNPVEAKKIQQDIMDYASLGTNLKRSDLIEFCNSAKQAKEAFKKMKVNDVRKKEYQKRINEARDVLVRTFIGTGAIHSVFEKTILYLLRINGPLTTSQLYEEIEWIHPDLCSDEDRVIHGRNFGRKWKHAMRTAQQHLRRRGQIHREKDRWFLTSH